MKHKNQHRPLLLQSWQSDQWNLVIQNKPIVSARALHAINLARLCARPDPPLPPRTGRGSRFARHRLPNPPRSIRKPMLPRMAAREGIS